MVSSERSVFVSAEGSHRCRFRSRMPALPEISVSVRNPDEEPCQSQQPRNRNMIQLTIMCLRLRFVEHNVGDRELSNIPNVERHDMGVSKAYIFI